MKEQNTSTSFKILGVETSNKKDKSNSTDYKKSWIDK